MMLCDNFHCKNQFISFLRRLLDFTTIFQFFNVFGKIYEKGGKVKSCLFVVSGIGNAEALN